MSPLSRRPLQLVLLVSALIVAGVVLVAAYGKLFYPSVAFKVLDRVVSVLEILFATLLLIFHRRLIAWITASLLFALWSGYSLYWYLLELPCKCMGDLFNIPTGFMVALDGIFLGAGLFFSYALGLKKKLLCLSILGAAILAFAGFCFAESNYEKVAYPDFESTSEG
ncbi:MAG: hypothetical protein JSS61_07305 [Verrucomicrobia bacterium]|nr:hypothetical protein [Verrucomicrobiota bacterium]